jgi:hypothetical protein
MKSDAENNVVDLRRYREQPAQAPLRSSMQSKTAPERLVFVALPIPFLVPIPVMWFPWWTR